MSKIEELYRQIYGDPDFHRLQRKRSRFNWCLTFIVMLNYFAFILIIAFNPSFFARPLAAGGTVTAGIAAGLGVIIISFLLTGLYVWRANKEFDPALKALLERHGGTGD